MKTNVAGTSIDRYHQLLATGEVTNLQAKILAHMEPGQGYTRAELSESTDLSINTLTGRVNELLEDGRLTELENDKRKCNVTGYTAKVVRLAVVEGV